MLAIALTAMLFTALFTIGLGTVENFQLATMRQSGGDSHGVIKNVTMEEYEKLAAHPLVKESAACEVLSDGVLNPEFLKRHVELWYVPEYHYPHRFLTLKEGTVPERADEVLVDDMTLKLLGLPEKTGQQITLSLQFGQLEPQVEERTFTVTGILKSDPALNVGFVITSKAYLTEHAGELDAYPGRERKRHRQHREHPDGCEFFQLLGYPEEAGPGYYGERLLGDGGGCGLSVQQCQLGLHLRRRR